MRPLASGAFSAITVWNGARAIVTMPVGMMPPTAFATMVIVAVPSRCGAIVPVNVGSRGGKMCTDAVALLGRHHPGTAVIGRVTDAAGEVSLPSLGLHFPRDAQEAP